MCGWWKECAGRYEYKLVERHREEGERRKSAWIRKEEKEEEREAVRKESFGRARVHENNDAGEWGSEVK